MDIITLIRVLVSGLLNAQEEFFEHLDRGDCEQSDIPGCKRTGQFHGEMVYLFEGKEEICKNRRKLISPFYFGGLYTGTDQNATLWEEVDAYIRQHYDALKCVYINGNGIRQRRGQMWMSY